MPRALSSGVTVTYMETKQKRKKVKMNNRYTINSWINAVVLKINTGPLDIFQRFFAATVDFTGPTSEGPVW